MALARCTKCGAENETITKFCGECGAKFVPRPDAIPVPGEDGANYCWKHRREVTRVSCGRCEKPICDRCMIVGPAGVRCKECAKRKVPVRMRGVLHNAGRGLGNVAHSRVWYLAVWYFVLSIIRNMFGGHRF